VAAVSGAIASQNTDVWSPRAATIAGAVVTACGALVLNLKPVEKLRYAHKRLADFEDVARRAENGLALGGGADLVHELTKDLWEISRRELPD
jgi:hypothetical protein